MIYGIGTDLADLERIKSMKSLSSFAKKILGDQELKEHAQLEEGLNQYYLANSLQVKKLLLKPWNRIQRSIFPKDIQILRNSLGKPEVILPAGAKSYVEDLGITKSHVSLADESNHLIAFAVLET